MTSNPAPVRQSALLDERSDEFMKSQMSEADSDTLNDQAFAASIRRRTSRTRSHAVDGLTCCEAQVDAILSEGEST
jgi:hypothetical protein